MVGKHCYRELDALARAAEVARKTDPNQVGRTGRIAAAAAIVEGHWGAADRVVVVDIVVPSIACHSME